MISCTEFVLFYSEVFKFIESKEGKEGVIKYWEHLSDTYVAELLGECVKKEGIKGCWTYWSRTLNEENCDFKMTFDEENKDFQIEMRGCPSKGHILEHSYMNPYHDYCGHCAVLYKRVLEKYGLTCKDDYSNVDKCQCITHFVDLRK